MAAATERKLKWKPRIVSVPEGTDKSADTTVFIAPKQDATEQFKFVQVNEFQPNVDGWNVFGNVTEYEQTDERSVLFRNAEGFAVQLRFISPSGFRVKFRPEEKPDYSQFDKSLAVVSDSLSAVNIKLSLIDIAGQTLKIDTGEIEVLIGCHLRQGSVPGVDSRPADDDDRFHGCPRHVWWRDLLCGRPGYL